MSSNDAKLGALPERLRDLHRALLEHVKQREQVQDRGTALLTRLLEDPLFEWLRELSQAMVLLDEALEEEGEAQASIEAILEQLRDMVLRDTGSTFRAQYLRALQESPQVILAHAPVSSLLSSIRALPAQ